MAIQSQWYVDRRVLFTEWSGDISTAALAHFESEWLEIMDSGEAPIHWVNDLSRIEHLSFNLHTAPSTLKFLTHPSLGWVLAYGHLNDFKIRFTVRTITYIFELQLREFNRELDAFDFLYALDHDLDWGTYAAQH